MDHFNMSKGDSNVFWMELHSVNVMINDIISN